MNLTQQQKNVKKGFGLFGSVQELEKRIPQMSDNQLLHKLEVTVRDWAFIEEQGIDAYYRRFTTDQVKLAKMKGYDTIFIRVLKNEKNRRGL